MDKENNANKVEREYTIPLRREWSKVPRYKRAKKAGKAVKEFLVRHMKVYDRDLKKIKIDKFLNEEVWFRGIKKPPIRIKVKAVKDSKGIVHVELSELPEKLKFKKAREERMEKKVEGKKKEKPKEEEQGERQDVVHKHEETKPEEIEEKKEEAEEKKAATIEGMEKLEKEMSKKMKHQKGGKQKEPKHQFRKALQK